MSYSFDFAAQVTRMCMDEIRKRGLQDRKILRKSAPNSVLFLKVFRQQSCTPDDLVHVSIHSVATLMQDTLWCCQERIVPKSVWRIINYETCTLSNLSRFITRKGEQLLIEILDFLVELMRHKSKNLMDAYHLGEAMGKVTLGPSDCDPIIAEKASHFLTRMIIEHSKHIHWEKRKTRLGRVDSGFGHSHRFLYSENRPMSKAEAALAKAKSYDRLIRKIRHTSSDWAVNTIGIQALLDNQYEPEPMLPKEPWISIFSQFNPNGMNDLSHDNHASSILYRILSEACKPKTPTPTDPFASSYLFRGHQSVETQMGHAFTEFVPMCNITYESLDKEDKQVTKSHRKKINHSLSHIKLNLRKQRPDGDLSPEETVKEESIMTPSEESVYDPKFQKQNQMRSMMKRAIKMNKRQTYS